MDPLISIMALAANLPFIAISFAIVGKGNRDLWLLVGPLLYLCLLLLYWLIDSLLPTQPTMLHSLLQFSAVTLIPAANLCGALIFKRYLAKLSKQNT